MLAIGLTAGLGASFFWALGSLLAYSPARRLGAFELTRTQLISAFFVLALVVTATDRWVSVSWAYAANFALASLVGVVLSNLAMMSCLTRGGPRRTQLLMTASSPMTAALAYFVYGEMLSKQQMSGILLVSISIVLAVVGRKKKQRDIECVDDDVRGSPFCLAALGLFAAICNAIGLIAMKPAITAGIDPLAATAIRTGGAALLVSVLGLWPVRAFAPVERRTRLLVVSAIVPGLLGYVVAVSLQLVALHNFDTGVAAALSSAAPVVILPMIWLSSGDRPARMAWISAGLAVAGVGLLVRN